MKHFRPIAVSMLTAALLAVGGLTGSALAHKAGRATSYHVDAAITTSGSGLHRRIKLKIAINGATEYDQFVKSSACPPGCDTIGIGSTSTPLRALALQANGLPDVVLGLYSGGAHCCFVDQVYSLDPGTGTLVKTEHDFADAGARIEDLNGDRNYEFLSADARLSNAGFTDYAHSPAPIQVFAFSNHRFRDITRTYPARIKKDAARWLNAFRHNLRNGRGMIAAWAADEYLLGQSALVKSQLAGALRAGHLGVPKSFGGPSPQKFAGQLQKLLGRLGYRR
jgi:hypothetical protein